MKGKMLSVGFLTMQTIIVEGKQPSFRVNAGSFMDAGYKKVIWPWGGEVHSDVTCIEVTARLHRMVKTPMDVDTDRVSIEIETGVILCLKKDFKGVKPEFAHFAPHFNPI